MTATLLDALSAALASSNASSQSVTQLLAEIRLNSELPLHLPEDPADLAAMVQAYIAGLSGGDAPFSFRTPQAVILAYVLGTDDKEHNLKSLAS